ncbi:MAG: 1,2-phenylacetyl-CoA epoxidase subunit PaaE [Flavobacteriales bacterium]|nr:1,2-phenylacetyl-CoA epoxidase subunit PaaE [Flavobacteriales bacterium]
MRPKFHALRVAEVRRETKDCVSIAFQIPAEHKDVYQFKHGQYLTLRAFINGEDLRRSYSICSGIGETPLRVAVKEVDDGIFSSWVSHHLKAGDEIQVMTPTGHFTTELNSTAKKNYLLVAAGSGITPIISIAKSVLKTEQQSEVTLIFGNRWFNSIIFREELEDLKDRYFGRFRLFHVLSAEPNDLELFHGRIDREKLEGFSQSFIDFKHTDEVFVCGPEPMIHAVKDFATEMGIAKENIHFELFTTPEQAALIAAKPAEEKRQTSEKICHVTIVLDGVETKFNMPVQGAAILDAAQAHGLDIPFSCKGGMCCTCRAHLSKGTVEMDVNYALEPGEVEAGFILTCQSHPTSDSVLVNYDKQN